MNIVNCTPHAISLRNTTGEDIVLPPSGHVARVSSTPGVLENVPGIPVPVAGPTTFGAVVGLPDPQKDTMFIVSGIVLSALRGSRPDVLGPGTGPNDGAIRDDQGRIVAVTRLVRG